jgi:hypothetical protein
MKKDIRHFVLETKELGTFDVVEYKEYQEFQKRIDNAIKITNKALCPNSDYVDYDFGTELLRQELLEILDKGE